MTSIKKDKSDAKYSWHMFDNSIIVGWYHPASLKRVAICEDKRTSAHSNDTSTYQSHSCAFQS